MAIQAPFDMRLHVWVTTLQSRLNAGSDTDQASASADLAVKALNKQFKADFRQKKSKVLATEAAIQEG